MRYFFTRYSKEVYIKAQDFSSKVSRNLRYVSSEVFLFLNTVENKKLLMKDRKGFLESLAIFFQALFQKFPRKLVIFFQNFFWKYKSYGKRKI